MNIRKLILIVTVMGLFVNSLFSQAVGEPLANLKLFTNGTIYLDAETKVHNLLIGNGKVLASDVNPAVYSRAEVVDLAGATVCPGFSDSHVHLVGMAMAMATGVPLNGASEAAEIAQIVGARAASLPDGIPVIAHGFVLDDYDAWSLSDLAMVDATTGSRPVMIADQLGHSYIFNSAAMDIAGIDGSTPEPPGGKIILENGVPTGMFRETAGAIVGNTAIFPLIKDSLIKPYLIQLLNTWASMGYTSIVELMGGPMGRMLTPELCREIEREGKLPLRIDYAYTFFTLDDMDGYLDAGPDTDLVRFSGLKLFIDGAAGNGGAWTSWPNEMGDHGLFAFASDDSYGPLYNLFRVVEKADMLGLDMHYHVGGDNAIEAVLQAIEKVLDKKGSLSSTHTLYHLGFITDDQIARAATLGDRIVFGVQPTLHWEYSKQITSQYYGSHAQGSYPYRKMIDAGVTVTFSTDFASNLIALSWPSVIMKVSMTGAGDPEKNPPVAMHELITGFTSAGYTGSGHGDTGKLLPGFWADMVVFEKDLYDIPPEELGPSNPKVLATWVGGKKAYSNPAAGR